MMMNKKGQGLSLTTIIVAALALIVLVVLVTIFVGQTGDKTDKISKAGNEEIVLMKISYGQCHPATSAESTFRTQFGVAGDDSAKDEARAVLREEISRCKSWNNEKDPCQDNGCVWS